MLNNFKFKTQFVKLKFKKGDECEKKSFEKVSLERSNSLEQFVFQCGFNLKGALSNFL